MLESGIKGTGSVTVVPENTAAVTIRNEDPKKAQNFLKTVTDKSCALDELSISMAEPEEEN